MESCLSLEQKINVKRPKLIAEEKNEVWEKIRFFQKKSTFFENLKFLKKTAPGAVFFENFIRLQIVLELLLVIIRASQRYRWKANDVYLLLFNV